MNIKRQSFSPRTWLPVVLFSFFSLLAVPQLARAATIDVMLVYDTTGTTWVNSNGGMAAFSQDVVNRMNQATSNSGLDLQFRLVHSMSVAYTHNGLDNDLNALQAGTGAFAPVASARNTYGADLVSMLVDTGSAYGWVGLGYMLTTYAGNPNYAHTTNSIRSVAISHTLTHEIGHNLGAHHAKCPKHPDSACGPNEYLDNQYSAGHYFTGTNSTKYHTIMAYNVDNEGTYYQPAPLFSTPLRTYQGTTAGVTNSEDNARLMRDTMGVVANYRPTAVLPDEGAKADFNGDNKSDLLLYTQSNGGGTVMRLMNGATVSSSNWLGYAGTNRTMYPADFSGDGKSDIAIYNFTDGGLVMWMMNGATRTSAHWLGYAGTAREVFAADFNGDKKSDLLFYDPTTGGLVMWIMNGATRTSAHWLGYYANSQLTTGDFNGDGKADILFRNASDGGMVMRMMNGATISSAHWLGYRANTAVFAGDFNADGKDDLLLQNTADRGLVLWMMNGASISSAHWLGYAPQPVRFANRDFNGDGKADILMRNTSDGGSIMWIMNGATRTSANWMGYLTDLY